MSVENFDFAKLIQPIEPETFFNEYWEQRPLILSRQEPDYYRDLFTIQDVDKVLFYTRPHPPEVKIVKNQQELLPSKYINADSSLNLNQLYKAYDEGHTIIVNGLQQFWEPLAIFSRSLQNLLNHKVVPNLYLSPKNSQGLLPHYDTHDVFVLQIEGSKNWQVYPAPQPVPLLGSFQPIIPQESLPQPLHEVCLEAGDLLYMPRGFIHQATTAEPSSLHITVGIYPIQWLDLINNALIVTSMKEARFRRALPPGFLNQREELMAALQDQFQGLLELFASEARLEEALEVLADQAIRQAVPVPDGHFAQVNEVDNITLDTVVAKRAGMTCRVVGQGFATSIQFPGNTVSATGNIEPALRFIANTDSFPIHAIPNTNNENRLKLVRRLVRGGLLRIVEGENL
jgi:ribosomal protein L16 Arg81 hydroxylase